MLCLQKLKCLINFSDGFRACDCGPFFMLININKERGLVPRSLFPKFSTAWEPNRNRSPLGCTLGNPWVPILHFCRATTRCPTKTIRRIKEHDIQNIGAFCIIFLQYYTLATCHLRNFSSTEYQQFVI